MIITRDYVIFAIGDIKEALDDQQTQLEHLEKAYE